MSWVQLSSEEGNFTVEEGKRCLLSAKTIAGDDANTDKGCFESCLAENFSVSSISKWGTCSCCDDDHTIADADSKTMTLQKASAFSFSTEENTTCTSKSTLYRQLWVRNDETAMTCATRCADQGKALSTMDDLGFCHCCDDDGETKPDARFSLFRASDVAEKPAGSSADCFFEVDKNRMCTHHDTFRKDRVASQEDCVKYCRGKNFNVSNYNGSFCGCCADSRTSPTKEHWFIMRTTKDDCPVESTMPNFCRAGRNFIFRSDKRCKYKNQPKKESDPTRCMEHCDDGEATMDLETGMCSCCTNETNTTVKDLIRRQISEMEYEDAAQSIVVTSHDVAERRLALRKQAEEKIAAEMAKWEEEISAHKSSGLVPEPERTCLERRPYEAAMARRETWYKMAGLEDTECLASCLAEGYPAATYSAAEEKCMCCTDGDQVRHDDYGWSMLRTEEDASKPRPIVVGTTCTVRQEVGDFGGMDRPCDGGDCRKACGEACAEAPYNTNWSSFESLPDDLSKGVCSCCPNDDPELEQAGADVSLYDFKNAEADCKVGEWGAWSAPRGSCPDGKITRTRDVTREARFGGKECPPLEHSVDCRDCVMGEWGPWGACDKKTAKRSRTRDILTDALVRFGRGAACGPTEEEENCPVDCETTEWGDWSECKLGSNLRTRTRKVTLMAKNGGACPPLEETREFPCEGCITSDWSEWGPCVDNKRIRTREKIRDGSEGSPPCVLEETQYCQNCEWKEWGEWQLNSQGEGFRTRGIAKQRINGGERCTGGNQQRRTNCKIREWRAGPCVNNQRTLTRKVFEATNGGKACPPTRQQR